MFSSMSMHGIRLDSRGIENFIEDYEMEIMTEQVYEAHDMLANRNGAGKNMLGWMDLPNNRDDEEINRIKECAKKIQNQADVFIVIGIGGSYLGARAVIEMLNSSLYNMESLANRKYPQIIFAGNNLSSKYIRNLFEYISDKDIAINVISKSGTTLEPAVTFRLFKVYMEEKYGKRGASERIYVTTDKEKGILHDLALEKEYERFVIPDNVGGRYSVLSPVGLLPLAVCNIDIEDLLDGALFASHVYNERDIEHNDCYKYAAYRNILNQKGKDIEILCSYEPSLQYFIEWYKQLFGESEGKENKGIFPTGVNFTTDLHSLGQYIQQGKRNIFETVINITTDRGFATLPHDEENLDNLNYLEGKEIDYINKQAFEGTLKAHVDGGVPNIVLNVDDINTYAVGQLIFFFEKACAISGYILGVNPFDQPGVEAYKKEMMGLLTNEVDKED